MKENTAPKTVAPVPGSNEGQLGETLGQICTYLEQLNTPQQERAATQECTTTNILIEEEALRLKSRISYIWAYNLTARRLAYWQSYRNKNIANKYAEWLNLEEKLYHNGYK